MNLRDGLNIWKRVEEYQHGDHQMLVLSYDSGKRDMSVNAIRIWVSAFLSLLIVLVLNAQEIRDIIQLVKIHPERQDTVLVSDMFYAKHYDLRFGENDKIAISYDPINNRVVFSPKHNFRGATIVQFVFNGSTYAIPVVVQSASVLQQKHRISYRPTGKVSKVAVSGSFNNWSKDRDLLTAGNGNSEYEITLPLDPGSYIYKIIVDGKEILDPSNPEKAPTGFDDFNSVLRIADSDTSMIFLHIGGRKESDREVSFSFIYENSKQRTAVVREDVIALLDNGTIAPGNIRIHGNDLEIRCAKKELRGDRIFRVLVSHDGAATNLQQAVLHDGIPTGKESTPFAWADASIYSIMVDRFNDGDASNDKPVIHDSLFLQANYQGGDFRGIINKIDDGYFDSLGINTLWISPVYDNPDVAFRESPPPHRWYSGYHGYWPISDTLVEEKFGTMSDLKELVGKAHKHQKRVLLDIVAHHVHIDHPFYKDHPEWFGTLDLPDGRKNLRLWDEYRLSTWFEPYMPSFDFTKSQRAIDVISDNAIWWLNETGADGFRHDAVKHVPNKFWRELTRKLKEEIEIPTNRKVYQIGETFGDYDLVASYVNNGQLSAQFNFDLSYSAIPVFLEYDRSFSSLDFHMKKTFSSFGNYHLMGNIMDSHDKVRYMAYADGKVRSQGVDTRELAWTNPPTVDHSSSYKKAELYLAYMFTIPGLPVVYYGSEFGMTGADDPDNRRMMRFGDQLSSDEQQMLEETRTIVKLRNQHSALRYGDFLTLKADETAYVYLRSDMNERLLIVLNKSESPQTLALRLPSVYRSRLLVDVLKGTTVDVLSGVANLEVPGIGWRVFRVQ
jgi:cyclomaltodextrinase